MAHRDRYDDRYSYRPQSYGGRPPPDRPPPDRYDDHYEPYPRSQRPDPYYQDSHRNQDDGRGDMFHFRGAANARNDSYRPREDHYRPRDNDRDPRDFSFRMNEGSTPSFAPSNDQQYGNGERRRSRRNQGGVKNQPGRGRPNHRGGRGRFIPKAAYDRAIMRAQREPTPEQLKGMGDGQTRFKILDDESDTSSEAMDLGTPDDDHRKNAVDGAVDLTADDSDDEEHPRAKRARIGTPVVEETKPKWSNPDPYTALPPPAEGKKVGENLLKLMRKAKNEIAKDDSTKAAGASDFISLNFDDEEEDDDEGEVVEISSDDGLPAEAAAAQPVGGRSTFSHLDNLHPDRYAAPPSPPPGIGVSAPSGLPQVPPMGKLDVWPPPPPPPPKADQDTLQVAQAVERQDVSAAPTQRAQKAAKRKREREQKAQGEVNEEWDAYGDVEPTPWRSCDVPPREIHDSNDLLHQEILQFYEFVKPQEFETVMREDLIKRLQLAVQRAYPAYQAQVLAFGSYRAGLHLPTADMDIVVNSGDFMRGGFGMFRQNHSQMRKFAANLERNDIVKPGSLTIIAAARVPIIKFVEKHTQLRVDISFENATGTAANQTFSTWKERYPAMLPVVALIKQFLSMRDLAEVHTGGLGGFSVICLIVCSIHFLQVKKGPEFRPEENLDLVLMAFLHLYGRKFDLHINGLEMDPIRYIKKGEFYGKPSKPGRLLIVDPNNPVNDISGGSAAVELIFDKFGDALDDLERRMNELEEDGIKDMDERWSILGTVWGGDYSSFTVQRDHMRKLHDRLHPDQRQRTASAGKVLPATRLAQATSKTTGAGAMTDSTMRTGVSTSKRNNPPAPTSTNNKKQVQPPTSGAEPPPKRQRGPKKKAAAMRVSSVDEGQPFAAQAGGMNMAEPVAPVRRSSRQLEKKEEEKNKNLTKKEEETRKKLLADATRAAQFKRDHPGISVSNGLSRQQYRKLVEKHGSGK